MLDLIQITNDPALARRCDALEGIRLFVDLERLGKAERQAGRNTFISLHTLEDVGRIKSVLHRSRLMVRVNPLHAGTAVEVEDAIAQGADLLMLPMFADGATLREFARIVDGRRGIVPLVETADALHSVSDWVATPGLWEVFVGLNDLHISMGLKFMFEPLAMGRVDGIAKIVKAKGLRFGFGGIARLEEGLLSGRQVLGEHVRLGSNSVILSRTFHRDDPTAVFEDEIAGLRQAERELGARDAAQVEAEAREAARRITEIASGGVSAAR